jgi:hypothetical protein
MFCTSVESSLNAALMPSMSIVRSSHHLSRPLCILHYVVSLRNFVCYLLLLSSLQEKAAEHAADSRRQFNMLPVGFKGFREAQEGTGRVFIAVVCSLCGLAGYDVLVVVG